MRILIIEPSADGHRMALYVRHAVKAMLSQGWEIALLTTREAVRHPAFALLEEEAGARLSLHVMSAAEAPRSKGSLALMHHQIEMWRMLRRRLRAITANETLDLVYLPTIDWVAKAIGLLGSPFGDIPFVGLLMVVTHARRETGLGPAGRQDGLNGWFFERMLASKKLRKLLVIDEVFYDRYRSQNRPYMEKLHYVPDCGEIIGRKTRDECRMELDLPSDAFVILVYGSLTNRKSIRELLCALLEPDCPSNALVLLAGCANEDISSLLVEKDFRSLQETGRLLCRLFFHDVAQEYSVFRSADLVWLAYGQGFYGSSGVLYQAASAGLPVLGMNQGLIGHLVRKYRLGVTVDPTEPREVASVLARMTENPVAQGFDALEVRAFSERHTAVSHAVSVLTALGMNGRTQIDPLDRNISRVCS